MTLTDEQKAWCEKYEHETGFDVMFPERSMTFEAVAQFNIDWFEDYASDTLRRVSDFPKGEQYWMDLLK